MTTKQKICEHGMPLSIGCDDCTIRRLHERVAELEQDEARIDWLESSRTSHGFCHTQYGEFRYYAHQADGLPTVRQSIDAARSKEQGK